MAGTLSVQKIQGLATSATPTTVEISSGHKLTGAAGSIVAPGSVIQVVSTTIDGQTTTSSTSTYASTPTAATITPTSATSKILVSVSSGLFWLNGSGGASATIYRNGSNIHPNNMYFVRTYPVTSPGSKIQTTGPMSYLDSPASTSALTYTVYVVATWGGTVQWGSNGNDCATMTLQEIAQ